MEWTQEQTNAKIAALQRTLQFVEDDLKRVQALKQSLPPAPSSQISSQPKALPSVLGKRTADQASLYV